MAVTWASDGAEASGHRGGGMSPCQRGGRARPSLHGCIGGQVRQYLAGSSGISLERSCDCSFSLGVHRLCRYSSGATVLAVLISDVICMIVFEEYSTMYGHKR